MEFKILNQINQLDEIDSQSQSKLQVIFKHSTRCSTSLMAKRILSGELDDEKENLVDVYYLDLLSYRVIAQNISSRYNIQHESPQMLVIKNGKCIYHASHSDVSLDKAIQQLAA